jgi:hypothetical protein
MTPMKIIPPSSAKQRTNGTSLLNSDRSVSE